MKSNLRNNPRPINIFFSAPFANHQSRIKQGTNDRLPKLVLTSKGKTPIIHPPLSEYLEETFIDLTETLRSQLGKNKTSFPLFLTLFALGIAILLSVGLPLTILICIIIGWLMASVVGTSDNPRIREFNRRQVVGLVHNQITNRKFEDRVKESQWFLDALAEMHKDIVFECTVVEEKELGGGEMEKKGVGW
jgi:hypothetical protein